MPLPNYSANSILGFFSSSKVMSVLFSSYFFSLFATISFIVSIIVCSYSYLHANIVNLKLRLKSYNKKSKFFFL